MKNRHILSSLSLVVAVMFLLSVSVSPAMGAEAINKELGTCTACSNGMNDLSSIPGMENAKVPQINIREIASDASKAASAGPGYGTSATVSGTQKRHVSSAMTFEIQDPRILKTQAALTGVSAPKDPALEGFIVNMSSEGYDFNGESLHRYESTLQSADFLTLNSTQKQALKAGGFAFTAEDTILSQRDAIYYSFTNRSTQTKRYLMEVQRLDSGGNPIGEREYTISPEFNADGSAVKDSYGTQSGEKTCFWQWVAVVIVGIGLIIVIAALIAATFGTAAPALAGAALGGNILAIKLGAGLLGAGLLTFVGPGPAAYIFSSSAIVSLTLLGLGILVLFLYVLFNLLVCKGVIPWDVWMNHDWDHQGGEFGLSDNGKTNVLFVHDRFMLTLFADTNTDKDAHWTIASLPAGFSALQNNTVNVKDGKTQSWLFEATGAGPKELIMKYETTKPVPPTMEITRYTLSFNINELPWSITTVDSTPDKRGVGQYNSVAIDKAGIPHISYYDAVNKRIMYASWSNNAWITEKVAGTDGTYTTSLAFDPAGNPAISYGDGYNYGNLMFAHRNGSVWSVEKVDNGGSIGNVGHYSSLVIDPAGIPHISYNEGRTFANLNYATKNGSEWKISTIDNGGPVGNTGYGSSQVLDGSGQAYVAYTKGETYGTLMFAQANRSGTWEITKVDNGGGNLKKTGYHPSIALDTAGNPHISYFDESDHSLRYASWNGNVWGLETVHNSGIVGMASSLAIDIHDQPYISYYDASNKELRFATRYPGTQGWAIRTVANNNAGEYSSIALDTSGHPVIAFYDDGSHALKFGAWKN